MDIAFLFLGLLVGALGTMVGAGGGFLLTPLLIFMFPDLPSPRLTAISLLAIFANSLSGSVGYYLRKQIHWRSMVAFSVTAIPGAIFGIYLGSKISRADFESLFAVFLLTFGSLIVYRSIKKPEEGHENINDYWHTKKLALGVVVSFFVGIISSLLGVGGGIIHVPLLAQGLGYPVHLAAGTSHAILAASSGFSVLEHFFKGDLENLPSFVPYLIIGLVIGAQIGAHYSKKVSSKIIMRVLGMAVISVAIRLLIKHWF